MFLAATHQQYRRSSDPATVQAAQPLQDPRTRPVLVRYLNLMMPVPGASRVREGILPVIMWSYPARSIMRWRHFS